MSKSELHNWECAIEKLSGDNADKMLTIAQDIYNTAFIRGKNYISLVQEPCEDCISRQAVLKPYQTLKDSDTICIWLLRKNIEQQPPVTPQPKIGHWIKHEPGGIGYIECSECLCWFLESGLLRNSYCPNCGAKNRK